MYNIDRLHSVKKREVDFNCHQCDSNTVTIGFGQDTLVRKVLVDRFWATILDLVNTLLIKNYMVEERDMVDIFCVEIKHLIHHIGKIVKLADCIKSCKLGHSVQSN